MVDSKQAHAADAADSSANAIEDEAWQELMGSELVMKKLVSYPDTVSVQPQDAVVLDFVGSYAPSHSDCCLDPDQHSFDTQHPVFHAAKDWLVVIGDKDVVPALELGIRFLNVGETAVVWSHSKYAYGLSQRTHGDYALPANANVQYRVTVRSILSPDDPHYALKVAAAKKGIGNDAFQNEWDDTLQAKSKALHLYKRGADHLQQLVANPPEGDPDLIAQARSVYLDCLNNAVAVHLRSADYHAAKEAAIRVLSVDPHNIKALLRAAKAALMDPASSYEEVRAALDAAAVHAATDQDRKDLYRLQQEFRRQRQVYQQRNRAMMANMSKAMASDSSTKKEDGEAASSKDAGLPEKDEILKEDDALEVPAASIAEESPETAATTPSLEWRKLLTSLFSQLLIAAFAYAFTIWVKPYWSQGGSLANPQARASLGEF